MTFYELDLDEDHGVSLTVEPNTMQADGVRIAVNVDGRTLAAYLGPRDRARLADALRVTHGPLTADQAW